MMKALLFLILFSFPIHAAERIISLKPNITEILFELGAGDQVIGVTSYCDTPEAAKAKEKVADYVQINVEKVMWLKPDLVLDAVENNDKREIKFLKDQGMTVEILSFRRMDEIYASIRKVGELVGKSGRAEALVDSMQNEFKKLKDKIPANHPALMVVVGVNPLVVVGRDNFLDDAFTLLGIANIGRDSVMRYPTLSSEQLIAYQPAVILDLSMGTEGGADRKPSYMRFNAIPAVRDKKVFLFDMNDFRPSPRLMDGLKKLVESLAVK